jgi:hypothetical protein
MISEKKKVKSIVPRCRQTNVHCKRWLTSVFGADVFEAFPSPHAPWLQPSCFPHRESWRRSHSDLADEKASVGSSTRQRRPHFGQHADTIALGRYSRA